MRKTAAHIIINANPLKVFNAFVDPVSLKGWWGVDSSLVQQRVGGLYVIAWKHPQGGFMYLETANIKKIEKGLYLELENLVYCNAERSILGPMSLLIECTPHNESTHLYVCQSGYQDGGDWDWYYDVVAENWPKALQILKSYLEK